MTRTIGYLRCSTEEQADSRAGLEAQRAVRVELDGKIRHYRLEEPLEVMVDGAAGLGAVLRENRG